MAANPQHVMTQEFALDCLPGLQDRVQVPLSLSNQAPADCIQYILHLLWIGQGLRQHHSNASKRLCQEIKKITQGKAQLVLLSNKTHPVDEMKISFEIQFGNTTYGTLYIAADKHRPAYPALSVPGAHLLAQVCGWLLYALEQSLFLQGQCQRLYKQADGILTKREQEILKLICWGYNQEDIAEKLCISPGTISKHFQHIYEHLGVHNERDALFAAYKLGLFSILEQPSFF